MGQAISTKALPSQIFKVPYNARHLFNQQVILPPHFDYGEVRQNLEHLARLLQQELTLYDSGNNGNNQQQVFTSVETIDSHMQQRYTGNLVQPVKLEQTVLLQNDIDKSSTFEFTHYRLSLGFLHRHKWQQHLKACQQLTMPSKSYDNNNATTTDNDDNEDDDDDDDDDNYIARLRRRENNIDTNGLAHNTGNNSHDNDDIDDEIFDDNHNLLRHLHLVLYGKLQHYNVANTVLEGILPSGNSYLDVELHYHSTDQIPTILFSGMINQQHHHHHHERAATMNSSSTGNNSEEQQATIASSAEEEIENVNSSNIETSKDKIEKPTITTIQQPAVEPSLQYHYTNPTYSGEIEISRKITTRVKDFLLYAQDHLRSLGVVLQEEEVTFLKHMLSGSNLFNTASNSNGASILTPPPAMVAAAQSSMHTLFHNYFGDIEFQITTAFPLVISNEGRIVMSRVTLQLVNNSNNNAFTSPRNPSPRSGTMGQQTSHSHHQTFKKKKHGKKHNHTPLVELLKPLDAILSFTSHFKKNKQQLASEHYPASVALALEQQQQQQHPTNSNNSITTLYDEQATTSGAASNTLTSATTGSQAEHSETSSETSSQQQKNHNHHLHYPIMLPPRISIPPLTMDKVTLVDGASPRQLQHSDSSTSGSTTSGSYTHEFIRLVVRNGVVGIVTRNEETLMQGASNVPIVAHVEHEFRYTAPNVEKASYLQQTALPFLQSFTNVDSTSSTSSNSRHNSRPNSARITNNNNNSVYNTSATPIANSTSGSANTPRNMSSNNLQVPNVNNPSPVVTASTGAIQNIFASSSTSVHTPQSSNVDFGELPPLYPSSASSSTSTNTTNNADPMVFHSNMGDHIKLVNMVPRETYSNTGKGIIYRSINSREIQRVAFKSTKTYLPYYLNMPVLHLKVTPYSAQLSFVPKKYYNSTKHMHNERKTGDSEATATAFQGNDNSNNNSAKYGYHYFHIMKANFMLHVDMMNDCKTTLYYKQDSEQSIQSAYFLKECSWTQVLDELGCEARNFYGPQKELLEAITTSQGGYYIQNELKGPFVLCDPKVTLEAQVIQSNDETLLPYTLLWQFNFLCRCGSLYMIGKRDNSIVASCSVFKTSVAQVHKEFGALLKNSSRFDCNIICQQ